RRRKYAPALLEDHCIGLQLKLRALEKLNTARADFPRLRSQRRVRRNDDLQIIRQRVEIRKPLLSFTPADGTDNHSPSLIRMNLRSFGRNNRVRHECPFAFNLDNEASGYDEREPRFNASAR